MLSMSLLRRAGLALVVGLLTYFVLLLYALACLAQATDSDRAKDRDYTIQVLAHTGQEFAGDRLLFFNESVAINDDNEILFNASSGVLGEQVFALYTSHQGRIARPGLTIGGHTIQSLRETRALNNAGESVFIAWIDDGSMVLFSPTHVYARSGEPLASGHRIFQFLDVVINDTGSVAFSASYLAPDGTGGNGIFVLNGAPRLALHTGQTFGDVTIQQTNGQIGLNDAGEVTIVGSTALNPAAHSVFTSQARIAGTGDLLDGQPIFDVSFPSINNLGEVAYVVDLDNNPNLLIPKAVVTTLQGVIVRPGDVLPVVGTVRTVLGAPVLSDTGEVVYMAHGTASTAVISSRRGVVLQAQQQIEAETLQSVQAVAVNNAGVIAAKVTFVNPAPRTQLAPEAVLALTPPHPCPIKKRGHWHGLCHRLAER